MIDAALTPLLGREFDNFLFAANRRENVRLRPSRSPASRYPLSWRDLRWRDNADPVCFAKPEITPPANANHLGDGAAG
jgi:hypothetical protein